MTNVLSTAETPISGTTESDASKFVLRSEIGAIESRIVRHVEEVTSGSEATQTLLRNELQQEGERRAERHSLHLCKVEASCMELTCRLNDAEQRWTAVQQDTVSELKSLQGHFEAVNSNSLSDRFHESDKRLQASRQELFAEVAKLRAEVTVRSEDAANERRLEFRSRTEQLETRIEEIGRNVAETAGFLVRLGAVEQQLAAARAHPSAATLDAKITTLTARVEAAEVKCRDLEHQAESRAKDDMKAAATAPAMATSPALALVVERLQARVEDTEKQLVAGGNLKKTASSGEIEELRTMVNDNRSHVELLSNSFATERQEYQKLLANVSKRQTDEQAILAHVVDQMHNELRQEVASRAQELAAKLRAELTAHMDTRMEVTEKDAIASVKESLRTGFQAALTELMSHEKQLQSAKAEDLGPRIANIEHELRGTTRLVTNLANRALDESSTEAGSTSVSTTDALSASTKVRSDMIQGLAQAIDQKINSMAVDLARSTRSTSPVQQGRQGLSMTVPAAVDIVHTRSDWNAAAQGLSMTVPAAVDMVHTRSDWNAAARAQKASAGLSEDLGPNAEDRVNSVPARGRSLEHSKAVSNAAAQRPHTALGTPRPSVLSAVPNPTDKTRASVKRQISARQPGHPAPRQESTPLSVRSPRQHSVDMPMGIAGMGCGPAPGQGKYLEVPLSGPPPGVPPIAPQSAQARRVSPGGQSPMGTYKPMGM